MNTENFNWLLHSLLFLHTERVIQRQKRKIEQQESSDDDDDEEEEEDIGIDIDRDE
jgi:hypothetical protein